MPHPAPWIVLATRRNRNVIRVVRWHKSGRTALRVHPADATMFRAKATATKAVNRIKAVRPHLCLTVMRFDWF